MSKHKHTHAHTQAHPNRGIRNNNPGNIKHSHSHWEGTATSQPDGTFVTFSGPEYGIRAMARILINYQVHNHLRTTAQIINRWAPPGDHNDTHAYVDHVASVIGVDPNARVDLRHDRVLLGSLVAAIIAHENSNFRYPQSTIDLGIQLATQAPVHPHENRSPHESVNVLTLTLP